MSEFLYVPPYLNWALFGSVSVGGSPGVLDAGHEAEWLVDGRPGFPLRLTETAGGATITNAAQTVSLIAVLHHLLDEDVVVEFGDDLNDSLVMPAVPRNGVRLNAWKRFAPVAGVSSVSVDVTGSPANSSNVLIGEVVIGTPLALDPPIRISGSRFGERHYVGARANELAGIAPYSDRARSRAMSGSQFYSQTMLDQIIEWWDSQDGYAYRIPSLIIPDSDNPYDARLVELAEPTYTRSGPIGSDTEYLVDLEFTELPRTRW